MKTSANPFEKRFLSYDEKGPREEQQDSCICLSSPQHGTALVVVSDGVGGKSGGRLASQKVKEMAAALWKQRDGKFQDPQTDLAALCSVSHQQINDVGRQHDMSPRATIVALYLTPTQATWAHSGDSRLFHIRAGHIFQRTSDHSVVEMLVKQGLVKESEMGEHPDQGTLLQSLGGEDYKDPSFGQAEIAPEDGFLLCTDGFWERTTPEEMGTLVASPAAETPALLKAAVLRAIQRNGPKGDNVTAALALPARSGIGAPPAAPTTALASTTAYSAPSSSRTPSPSPSAGGGGKLAVPIIAVIVFLIIGVVIGRFGFQNGGKDAREADRREEDSPDKPAQVQNTPPVTPDAPPSRPPAPAPGGDGERPPATPDRPQPQQQLPIQPPGSLGSIGPAQPTVPKPDDGIPDFQQPSPRPGSNPVTPGEISDALKPSGAAPGPKPQQSPPDSPQKSAPPQPQPQQAQPQPQPQQIQPPPQPQQAQPTPQPQPSAPQPSAPQPSDPSRPQPAPAPKDDRDGTAPITPATDKKAPNQDSSTTGPDTGSTDSRRPGSVK